MKGENSEDLENIARSAREREKDFEVLKNNANETHKAKLFQLITKLTLWSFFFLVFLIMFKMLWKIRHPEYQVISDTVINIVAIGVFAELVGVVGIVAKLLWK